MNPQQAFFILLNNPNHPNKKNMEKIISQDSSFCFYYAKHVIIGKLPEFMHNTMICHAIANPEDECAKSYFDLINRHPWDI